MTSKNTATLNTNTVITTGLPAAKPKPSIVVVTGPVIQAMQTVSQLVRMGYVPDANLPLDFFGSTGAMSVTLLLGSPDADAIAAASQIIDDAREMEVAQYANDVAKEAARQLAAAEQVKRDAQRAALIAAHAVAVAKLEADLAAAQ